MPDSGERKSPPRRGLVQARVSPRELAAWRSKAASAGVSSSALLRQAMARTGVWAPSANEVERARRREVERERTRELVRIGNNLNQIARWANRHKSAADAAEVSLHLAAIELALRALARPAG
ncbi:MAG: MobC family plasmid mobilization relaxosome protein [Acidobacteria bacterium]|nr:MobC family plasmid mobilization relaxosome protein [Acidobacteriota bacterium]